MASRLHCRRRVLPNARTSTTIAVLVAVIGCVQEPEPQPALEPIGPELRLPPDGELRPAPSLPERDLPDLTVNPARALVDLAIDEQYFSETSCEVLPDEDCVGGTGWRTLLRFAADSPNVGTADVFIGAPDPANSEFIWSDCHGHYHWTGYAHYALEDEAGKPAARGQKAAYCLMDAVRFIDAPDIATEKKYTCNYQGIQVGWSDVYGNHLPCQWIDVTDTPSDTYRLVVAVNHERRIEELDYTNNQFELVVDLDDPALRTPTEPCPDVDDYSGGGLHRECGWDFRGTFPCTPGATVRIGCSAACPKPLGGCQGDPMLRVCDASDPDGNCSRASSVAENNNICGTTCPLIPNATCPAGGEIDVFTAPFLPDGTYTCDLEIEELIP